MAFPNLLCPWFIRAVVAQEALEAESALSQKGEGAGGIGPLKAL